MLAWFHTHRPAAKAALIVNSVATALRLEQRLQPLFALHGLSVVANTGITGRALRTASYAADLLIGTSTVDVGVDFRINLLIFESLNAGTFLQRLGRLGRHTTYRDRDGREHRFAAFAAHALVPPFLYERLTLPEAGQPAPLHSAETYTREQLANTITAVFPRPTGFQSYTRFWGRFVPAKVMQTLSGKVLRPTFGPQIEPLLRRYGALIQGRVGDAMRESNDRRAAGEELLIEEAQSFRGGSPFDCGVLKDDENDVVTYDLLWLLANAHLEVISHESFCAAVRRLGKSDLPYRRGYQRFFFRWRGLRAQRETVQILLGPQVAAWGPERQQSAQVLPGIQLDCAGHEYLNTLNRTLIALPCVGLLVPAFEPRQLQRTLYLPPGFHLLPYRIDDPESAIQTGTFAFGRAALLLDSRLRVKPLGGMPDSPMIY
ncbi:MAG: type I-D CRISPR-associated helicase Cas3' [Oscillochloris sp.]|nr:type I-D CRISPR-associated helicase Cas3' [Oscillochloris sp.]